MGKVLHDSETPAGGKQVVTACAFIHKTENGEVKVFSAKRAATKKFLPNVWELPGGHIDFGEAIVAGLKREVREEFEVEISIGDPFAVSAYHNPVKGSHSIQVNFFATMVSGSVAMHPEDHSACGWFTPAEIERLFLETGRSEDEELRAIRKGFALLRGERVHTG